MFQEDHRSEQRTTLADVLSTSEEEKKLERAEDAEPIEDENENEQSTESQEPSAEPEPTGEETEIGDSYEVREGTEEEVTILTDVLITLNFPECGFPVRRRRYRTSLPKPTTGFESGLGRRNLLSLHEV